MKYAKKYYKSVLIFISSLIIIPIFLTLLNILKLKTYRVSIIIISSILMFIIGFILGKKTDKNGYLKGLLLSTICILILLILSLIFKYKLNINSLIYYIILIISTTFGSTLGINKKIKS